MDNLTTKKIYELYDSDTNNFYYCLANNISESYHKILEYKNDHRDQNDLEYTELNFARHEIYYDIFNDRSDDLYDYSDPNKTNYFFKILITSKSIFSRSKEYRIICNDIDEVLNNNDMADKVYCIYKKVDGNEIII